MYTKAEMLAFMGRTDATKLALAKETLKALRKEAGKNKHQDALDKTALLQAKLGLDDEAETTCDVMP